MITTEVLSQSDDFFTLSIKVNEGNEYFGRALMYARVPYLTIEQQVEQIVLDVSSRQVIVEEPVIEPVVVPEGE